MSYRMDTAAFDALAYGLPNPNTLAYLQQGIQQVAQYLTPTGQQFMAKIHDLYEAANGSEAMRKARAAIIKAQHLFQADVVMPMWNVGQFQNAGRVMQRYLMANPMVQQMYEDGRLDGYAGVYEHPFPGKIGEDNYNYRRVTNGMMLLDEDDDGYFRITNWEEDLVQGDRELDFSEKRDILHSWESIETLLKRGEEDPTSNTGGYL